MITFSSEDKKKIIVFSHERSGTHFLMNTIAANFGYIGMPWVDLDTATIPNPYDPAAVWNYLRQFIGYSVLNVFKSHYPFEFVSPVMDKILMEYEVFYIWRQDIEALFDSFARHIAAYEWNSGPAVDGCVLMKAGPSGALLRYQPRQYHSMLDRYTFHTTAWLESAKDFNIHVVRYEDLDEVFETEVKKIGKTLGRRPAGEIVRPPVFRVEDQ